MKRLGLAGPLVLSLVAATAPRASRGAGDAGPVIGTAPDAGARAPAVSRSEAAVLNDGGASPSAGSHDGALPPRSMLGDGGALGDAGVAVAAPAARAPSVRLRGRVLAKGTREPLAFATVTVDGDTARAIETDESGRFELDVPPGARTLQLVAPGFEPLTLSVTARAADSEQTFRLMPRQTGERFETIVVPPSEKAPRTSLREEELTRLPGALGDPFRTIESLPGVSQVAWPLPVYAIRGANPGNTGFFLDGARIPALFHLALGPSVIHPFFLQQLDFYPGGYPSRYGRYVSGIVAARTFTPKTDRPRGSIDVRLFDAGGIVAAPINGGKGSVAIAGRYSYMGLLFSIFSPDYKLGYWDYQARIDHVLGPGRLTLFLLGSSDDLGSKRQPSWGGSDSDAVPGTAGRSERAWGAALRFHRAELRWDGDVGRGRLEASAIAYWGRSSTFIPQLFGLPVAASNRAIAPRLIYGHRVLPWLDFEAGVDAEVQSFSPSSEGVTPGSSTLFRERTATVGGGFVELTARPGDRVVVSPGMRYDLFAESGAERLEPSPRLHARVRPFGDVWLKGTVGRFAQMPSLAVMIPGFENFGLRSYGVQTSWQGSGGVEAPLFADVTIDATGFYQRLRLTDLRSVVGGGNPQEEEFLEVRDGESYGGELLIRRPASHRLWGWISYTLSWSDRLVGFYKGKAPSDWDQRHILNVVGTYRLGGGYSIGGRFHLNTGRLYPVYSKVIGNVERYRRLPTYHQLDLRVDKRFVLDRYLLDLYVEVVNGLRTRQVFDTYREKDGALVETSFPVAFPSFGVHLEW